MGMHKMDLKIYPYPNMDLVHPQLTSMTGEKGTGYGGKLEVEMPDTPGPSSFPPDPTPVEFVTPSSCQIEVIPDLHDDGAPLSTTREKGSGIGRMEETLLSHLTCQTYPLGSRI
jgi:hypothetical protein